MLAGTQVYAGSAVSTILADFDFETYSEAGYVFNEETSKWVGVNASPPYGLPAVGASAYTQHESAEVLCMAYNLKAGEPKKLWIPGMPPPQDLFDHIAARLPLEAHNSSFEYHVWVNICVPKMGWPELPQELLRCSASKCRAHGLPGALKDAGTALSIVKQKDKDGTRLLNKFSKPRNPTKNDLRRRIHPSQDPEDANRLYAYCVRDIEAESEISERVPDLQPDELELWITDQRMNYRGVFIDMESVNNCIKLVELAFDKYNAELAEVTNGEVLTAKSIPALKKWAGTRGVEIKSLTKETMPLLLARTDLPGDVHRAIELRALIGSAAIEKLYAFRRRISKDSRMRDILMFCGADRTGRFAGRGTQPQNLPNSGPAVVQCEKCGFTLGPKWIESMNGRACQCGGTLKDVEWNIEAVDYTLDRINSGRLSALADFEYCIGDVVDTLSGCLRGMFSAAEGHDLICSDYSAIEAVVLAALAGEEWRMDVFRSHGKIYEMSASKISGVPFEEFERYKQETGNDHPLRKKLGKVAELGSGYQGGYGAWMNFGADKALGEEGDHLLPKEQFDAIMKARIQKNVKAWRAASPMIVKFWYGVEDAAKKCIQAPGSVQKFRGFDFWVQNDVMYVRLLSGRLLSYHKPSLRAEKSFGRDTLKIIYWGNNSDYKKGPKGWCELDTYGGKLTENLCQAVARDIMTFALVNLEKAGYPPVFHVHDEIISEIPKGHGSIKEFETIMATMPTWCADWPIRAAGGWRGRRYRK